MKTEVKKMKTGWIVFLIVVTCMFQLRNCFYTEDDLKWVAQRSLKKKYGEEFVIYRVWDKSQEMFFATCSPKDDPEVVFEGYFRKTGDNGGVIEDGYAQAVVAKEVNEMLKPEIERIYGNCYTRTFLNYYNVHEFKNAKNITLKEYMSQVDFRYIGYDIFVALPAMSDESINEEYEFWAKTIQEKIKNGELPNLAVDIYLADDEMIEECKEYYRTQAETYYDFGKKIDECIDISFDYENVILDITYEEYKSQRILDTK